MSKILFKLNPNFLDMSLELDRIYILQFNNFSRQAEKFDIEKYRNQILLINRFHPFFNSEYVQKLRKHYGL